MNVLKAVLFIRLGTSHIATHLVLFGATALQPDPKSHVFKCFRSDQNEICLELRNWDF